MIRKGDLEIVRESRRVYVRMLGPEYLSDEGLLRRAIAREDELQQTVRELERSASELKLRASELERERDEAMESAPAARRPYEELEEAYRKDDRRAWGDEGAAQHGSRDRHRAARRQRSRVVVCAEVGACLDDLRQPRTLNCSLRCSSDVAQPLAPQPDLPTCTSTTWPEPAHS